MIPAERLMPGLADPVFDSQRVFRAALEAFSHPGCWVQLSIPLRAPAPLATASAGFLLTMADFETPVWLQSHGDGVAEYLRFHCGAPLAGEPMEARFAVVTDAATMPPLDRFYAGEPEYPERSTTLIVQVERSPTSDALRLTGPGIPDASLLHVAGLHPEFWRQWKRNDARFPCGVDVVFACGDSLCALPRTTRANH